MAEPIQPVVIDNGTGFIKSGFAGDDAPRAVFPTIVGRPKESRIGIKAVYIGDGHRSLGRIPLTLSRPIEHGIIRDWADMEQIWHHTFYEELHVAPGEQPVLLTETPLSYARDRREYLQIMFETFNVPAMHLASTAKLALFASGRTTGCVVECGAGVTHVAPHQEGTPLKHCITRLKYAGSDVTAFLARMLEERGVPDSLAQASVAKEQLCYCAYNYEEELEIALKTDKKDKTFQLPDGKSIVLNTELFRCTEILFNPSVMNNRDATLDSTNMNSNILEQQNELPAYETYKNVGIQDAVYDAIMSNENQDSNLCRDLIHNVIMSGGSSLLFQMGARLNAELFAKQSRWIVSVATPPERKYSTWIGGSILASLSDFSKVLLIACS